nr:C-type lectin domain family 2 member B-like isoform X1 [Pogona vitticeps]
METRGPDVPVAGEQLELLSPPPPPPEKLSSHGKKDREQRWIYIISVGAAMVAILTAFIIIWIDYQLHIAEMELQRHNCVCPPVFSGPACPDDWIGYQGKCYYFSDVNKDWHFSLNACSSQNASLLTFSHDKEKDFVMRFQHKQSTWLGLSKGPDQLWRWTNGGNSTVPVVTGEGDCAYLNKDGGATGARCTTELIWICVKPDIFNRQNGTQ